MSALKAHAKLLKQLPVRTHICQDEGPPPKQHKRPVVVFGVRYESIHAAARATGLSAQAVHGRVMRGSDCYYAE